MVTKVANRRKCKHCNGWLVAVGTARKNGKNHSDWDTRGYHKKCYPFRSHTVREFKFTFGKHKGKKLSVVMPGIYPIYGR